jgi:predicted phage tail protein
MRTGTDAQTVIQKMQDNVGATKWSNNHKVSGVALLYANLTFDQSVYNGLPTVSVDVVGRKVPAAHITAGWVSTDYDNPAWALYDYLTNTRYGKGLDPAMIDMASFLSTKAYCNEMVNMLDKDNNAITQKRYVADGHIDTGKTIIDNVKDILTSMNAFMIQSGGKYKVRCNRAETPSAFVFDESTITGAWDILLGTKTNRFNQVKLTYFEPENDYQGNIFLVKDATYLASDNNQVYERELTLPLTCNYNRAAYIGRIIMNQSRFQTTVTFNAVQTAMTVEVGDVISITHPVPGWVEKKFRVMNMTIQPAGDVRLVCVEYNADVYRVLTS